MDSPSFCTLFSCAVMTSDSSTNDCDNCSNLHPFESNESTTPSLPDAPPESSNCWFLSVSCIDDIAKSLIPHHERSAFNRYERPTHVMSLFDASLDEEDEEEASYKERVLGSANVENRDDCDTNIDPECANSYCPSIKHTFSFDDWNIDDELVVNTSISPAVFRFDEGNERLPSKMSTESTIIKGYFQVESQKYTESSDTHSDDLLTGRSNNSFLGEHGSSIRPLLSASDSYVFQPICDEGDLCSERNSDYPTISITSLDPLSLSIETNSIDFHDVLECPGIPRASRNDHDQKMINNEPRQPHEEADVVGKASPSESIIIELTNMEHHSPAPIPDIIFVPKRFDEERTGVRRALLTSWKKVLRLRRKDASRSSTSKYVLYRPSKPFSGMNLAEF